MNQEYYIKRCIELAGKALGKTYPNPLVGSVIVHNDRIIGEGFHKKAGEPHAEINAITAGSKLIIIRAAVAEVRATPNNMQIVNKKLPKKDMPNNAQRSCEGTD